MFYTDYESDLFSPQREKAEIKALLTVKESIDSHHQKINGRAGLLIQRCSDIIRDHVFSIFTL